MCKRETAKMNQRVGWGQMELSVEEVFFLLADAELLLVFVNKKALHNEMYEVSIYSGVLFQLFRYLQPFFPTSSLCCCCLLWRIRYRLVSCCESWMLGERRRGRVELREDGKSAPFNYDDEILNNNLNARSSLHRTKATSMIIMISPWSEWKMESLNHRRLYRVWWKIAYIVRLLTVIRSDFNERVESAEYWNTVKKLELEYKRDFLARWKTV